MELVFPEAQISKRVTCKSPLRFTLRELTSGFAVFDVLKSVFHKLALNVHVQLHGHNISRLEAIFSFEMKVFFKTK